MQQILKLNFIERQQFIKKINLFVFLAFIFLSLDVLARAGGAGGSSSSGGDSGGDGGGAIMLIYYLVRLIFMLPFPLNIIVLGIIIVAAYFYFKNQKEDTVLNNISKIDKVNTDEESIYKITSGIPNFNIIAFNEKVKTAFFKIQDAWAQKDLRPVRQFISDGVYQRFEAQFIMMRELGQTNSLSDIKLHETKIITAENDGQFYILHVKVVASVTDYFSSEKFKELNSGGPETFGEYWTFVKKVSAQSQKDIFNSTQCPNCGSSIENKLGEVSKCDSCGTQINNGDYDWVLAEITQPEDFAGNYGQLNKRKDFYKRLQDKGYSSPEFSPQYIEDKASNAYLQIKVAQALSNPKRINRFCSEEFTQTSKALFGKPYLYNRLYLTDVSLVNIYEDSSNLFAALSISSVQQKVSIENNKLQIVNHSPVSVGEFLILSRSKKYTINQYSVMSHNCSGCGAPVEDSLQLTCNYCGVSLNDNTKDWIVEHLFSQSDYNTFKQRFSESVNSNRQENKLDDSNWDVRDYALNNMMLIALADGEMQDEERNFLIETSKDLGYNTKKITELFEEVRSGNLSLKMPNDDKKRGKVLKLMRKVAEADGNFNDNEKAIMQQAEEMVS